MASMRPRVFPAEDMKLVSTDTTPAVEASMRPRVFPAEDPLVTIAARSASKRLQ